MSIEGWGIGQLGEICSISIGGTPSRANPVYWDVDKSTDNLWVSIRDLNQRVITDTAEYLTNQGLKHSNVKELQSGTVLLSFKLTIGRVAIAGTRLYTNEAIAGLVSPGFAPDFLYYGLQQWDLLKGVDQAIKGATLNKQKLNKIEFNYPKSVQEQAQIAAVLSKIDLAITQTEAIIDKQQRIKTGLMQDLLTKGIDESGNIRSEATHEFKDSSIGRIPAEWEVKELREVSLIIDPNPSHRYPPSSDVGVPIASTENFFGDNDFDLSFSEKVPFHVFKQQNQRCHFSKLDIIFARKGRLGFARYYGESEKVFSHTVVIFKPCDKQQLETSYLLWLVRFRDFFDQIDKRMNSNSGVPTLGVQFLGSIPVRVPKLSEQIQICLTLDYLEKRIEEEKRNFSKQKRLKTGLMQDLLTGKVRVTPLLGKEPASR